MQSTHFFVVFDHILKIRLLRMRCVSFLSVPIPQSSKKCTDVTPFENFLDILFSFHVWKEELKLGRLLKYSGCTLKPKRHSLSLKASTGRVKLTYQNPFLRPNFESTTQKYDNYTGGRLKRGRRLATGRLLSF